MSAIATDRDPCPVGLRACKGMLRTSGHQPNRGENQTGEQVTGPALIAKGLEVPPDVRAREKSIVPGARAG